MSDNKKQPTDEQGSSGQSSVSSPQQGLENLVEAALPPNITDTMQHVNDAMAQSQKAIQESLSASSQLIAAAQQHLHQNPFSQPEEQQSDTVQSEGEESTKEVSGVNSMSDALIKQSEHMATSMQQAMQAVQASVQQSNDHMQQSISAREQALQQLVQGQQQNPMQPETQHDQAPPGGEAQECTPQSQTPPETEQSSQPVADAPEKDSE